jgi:cell division protein FtsQ
MKRKAVKMILFFAAMVLIIVFLGFIQSQKKNVLCQKVNITIVGDTSLHFINAIDAKEILKNRGFILENSPVEDINTMEIEKAISEQPNIDSVAVFLTINGDLNINITQKIPLLHVIDGSGESYYIDVKGNFMPESMDYTARVPVATGFIFDPYYKINTTISAINKIDSISKKAVSDDLYEIATEISKDSFLLDLTEQLYVKPDKEIEMIPKLGADAILIGDKTNLKEKLRKLKLFYLKGLPQSGWKEYALINLKFHDQLICTKTTHN